MVALHPWESKDAMSRFLIGLWGANLLPENDSIANSFLPLGEFIASPDSSRWPLIPDEQGSGFFYYLRIVAALPHEDESP